MRNKIATFCGDEDCKWCPELFIDNDAGANKAVILTDDFGGEIQMSKEKFQETKRHITTLCGSLSCDFCPEIFVDEEQVSEKKLSLLMILEISSTCRKINFLRSSNKQKQESSCFRLSL